MRRFCRQPEEHQTMKLTATAPAGNDYPLPEE
jgi:hypothetical protein